MTACVHVTKYTLYQPITIAMYDPYIYTVAGILEYGWQLRTVVVSQWHRYEELHFMHLQQCPLFVRGVGALPWSVGWASRTKPMASANCLLYSACFRFVWVNEEACRQTKNTSWTRTINSRHFVGDCANFGGPCRNLTPYGSAWALKECKNSSSIAFRLGGNIPKGRRPYTNLLKVTRPSPCLTLLRSSIMD
jgi:hypothetical protein